MDGSVLLLRHHCWHERYDWTGPMAIHGDDMFDICMVVLRNLIEESQPCLLPLFSLLPIFLYNIYNCPDTQ